MGSHPKLSGGADAETFTSREPSDGYAAGSARLASVTVTGTTDRLEEDTLARAEEVCVEIVEALDEELS